MIQQADKTKRGELLQEWLRMLQAKGLSKELALERIENYMQDPIKLRIINALAGS